MRPLRSIALALLLGAASLLSAAAAHAAPGLHTLYLVRHGIYDRDSTVDDRVGNGLSALGREQAAIVARYLARLPVHMHLLTSSTLTRARETGDAVASALRMSCARDSLISECTPSASDPAYSRNTPPAEISECEAQLAAAWAKYATPSPDGDVSDVLVCHGNVIRWFVAKTLAGDPQRWSAMDIANCSVTVITIKPDGTARLVMFDELGDLPIDKQTWAGKGPGWAKASGGMK